MSVRTTPRSAQTAPRSVVAVPVRDEREHIETCLRALTDAQTQRPDLVLVLVNNTTDGTAEWLRQTQHSYAAPLRIVEHWFAPAHAHAGRARQMAMDLAADLLCARAPEAALLTTDADAVVPPGWVAANLWCLRAGADAVAGRAVIDPRDAAVIPAKLHEDDARECAYAALLDEMAAMADPEAWDPWPRHCEHSGASIAVRLSAYRRAGGMPAPALGEDRQFFAALRRADARIRHAPEIAVTVSGRVIGRAEGGMADTIRRRLMAPDLYIDDALEPAAAHLRRVTLRQRFRQAFFAARADRPAMLRAMARDLRVAMPVIEQACLMEYCGAAWAKLEAASPVLRRDRVAVADLPAQTLHARRLLLALRRANAAHGGDFAPVAALAEPSWAAAGD